jgi:ankyrin repeat protein
VNDILQSTSDVLFPEDSGDRPVAVDSVGACGDTPLHVMAWRNDVEGAKLLLDAGANVDVVGDMGETPLHVAVGQGNRELVLLFLQAGANCDIRSEFGTTAKEEALARGGSCRFEAREPAGVRLGSGGDAV